MTRFAIWLTTVPNREEMFFMHIRQTASEIFDVIHEIGWFGHKWEYPRGNTHSSAIRRCPKCGREQWEQVNTVTVCKWRTVHTNAELP